MTKLIALCSLITLVLVVTSHQSPVTSYGVSMMVNPPPTIKETAVPNHVSLRLENVHICSGVLINNTFVLSTAHCLCDLEIDKELDSLNFTVHTGHVLGPDYGEEYLVKNITCHPDYKSNPNDDSYENDLAVILLAKEVQLPRPLSLAIDNTIIEEAIISGWAKTRPFTILAEKLEELLVSIIDNKKCQDSYKNTEILSSQICTFKQEKDNRFCMDSGSPLIYNNTLIGIFSWTPSCRIYNLPNVFTRISSYRNFILQAMLKN